MKTHSNCRIESVTLQPFKTLTLIEGEAMKRKFMTALTLAVSSIAFSHPAVADIIKCDFTEPFLSTEYSMAQQTFTIIDPVSEHPKTVRTILKNVSFQIKDAGKFELVDANKKII